MLKNVFSSYRDKSASKYVLNNRFALKLPPEWNDQSVYRYEGPVEDGIQHNIIVTIENNLDMPDLDTYSGRCIKAVEGELQGYTELKRGPVILKSGVPAIEVVYKWCPTENRKVYQRVIYILLGDTGYILMATFSKKTWKTFGPEVDKILMSFVIPAIGNT